MSLGSFLLKAMLDVGGHAVVIDTAAAPYVVTDAGPVEVANGALRLVVADDGVGGATVANGTGLVGLADRVEAQGGTLLIHSPPGVGTRIEAEIPCAS